MLIMLESGENLVSDTVVSAILRFDCTPIPVSLEFQVMLNEKIDPELQEDKTIYIGDKYIELCIIKKVVHNTSINRDGKIVVLGSYIAVLKGCEKLIIPSPKAIFLKDTTFGESLRASGSKLKISEDVPLMRYFCAIGATPTYEIARKCGEEAVVITCDEKMKIAVRRLSTITEQEPVLFAQSAEVSWLGNPNVLQHQIKTYQTVNVDGTTVEGELSPNATTGFYPNLDARRLKNLSTALVTKGTIMRGMIPEVQAGMVVEIDQKKYVALTVAHRFDSGLLGRSTVSSTKIWVAEVTSA